MWDVHLRFKLLARLRTKTGASDNDHLRPMKKTIQAGARQERVPKKVGPLSRGAITGEQDAALLIALSDDVVEVLWRGWSQRFETKIVNDQQIGTQVGGQATVKGIIRAPAVEMLKHLVGINQQHIEALLTCFVSQRLAEMAFADPTWPAD